MLSRMFGVLLLIRWLAPFFIGAAAIVIGFLVFLDVERVAREPVRLISESAEELKVLAQTAEAQLQQVKSDAQVVEQAFEDIPRFDITLPTGLTIPPFEPPTLDLTLPRLTPVNAQVPMPALSVTVPTVGVKDKGLSVHVPVVSEDMSFNVPEPDVGSKVETLSTPNITVPTFTLGTTNEQLVFPDIEDVTIPLPGPFNNLTQTVEGLVEVVDAVNTTLANVAELQTTMLSARADLEDIAIEAEALSQGVESIGRKWAEPVFWLLVAIASLIVLSHVLTSLDALRHSLRLIAGKGN